MNRWIWLLLSASALAQNATNKKVLDVTSFSGADIGAQLNTANSSACLSRCVLTIPAGTYTQETTATITNPNVTIKLDGAVLNAGAGLGSQIVLNGSGDGIYGGTFDLNGNATNAVIVSGSASDVTIKDATFEGQGAYGINAFYAGAGLAILDNTFKSDSTGHGPGPMAIQFTTDCRVIGNHLINTSGFGIPLIGSHHCTISNNDISEPIFTQRAIAAASQTSFTVTLPGHANELFAHVNGQPTALSSPKNTSGNTWTATFSAAPGAGAVVEFLGFQPLEDIQVNSQSSDVTITGNTANGSGDTAIDVVSSYHATILQTITSADNQTVFHFTGSPTFFPAVLIEGRLLTGSDILNGGPIHNGGANWTATLAKPQPAGTAVSFVDDFISEAASTKADYPENVTISRNTVSNAAAACISPEVPANNIDITGNVLENCGQGQGPNTSFSSAIFATGSPIINITNNTIISSGSVPTMSFGIEMLSFFTDAGKPAKTVVVSGNSLRGFGSSQTGIYIPTQTPTTRQIGIDIRGTDVPYPEKVDLDSPWSGLPGKTNYWTYANSSATVTRDTINTSGGAASMNITSIGASSNSYVTISPSAYQLFSNSILKVTFSAKAIRGTMDFQIFSFAGGMYAASTVPITSTSWQKYALHLATSGLDLSKPIFIRIGSPPATTAQAVFQNITLASTPINASSRTHRDPEP